MMLSAVVVNALLVTMNAGGNLSWKITLQELVSCFYHFKVFGLTHAFEGYDIGIGMSNGFSMCYSTKFIILKSFVKYLISTC